VNNDFLFGMAVVLYGEYDDYIPPILHDEYFIEISIETGEITKQEVDSIYNAYIFEIKATLNIDISENPRPELYEPYNSNDEKGGIKLRQLILGEGTFELLKLFNSVSAHIEPEIRVLYYSKVAEYVSQTIVKKELLETVLNKLNTRRALTPDADYVIELERIFEEQRNYKKDNEALRLTIETCCDIFELAKISPVYLSKVKKISAGSLKEDRIEALREFATAMSDTRNMIAHAKTNYTKKGKECPPEQINEFADCCMVAAIQVIRWYSRQHESIKIK
ncbi:MAG: hypothetical protein PHE26_11885, partial [Syntrophomonadaceae bacterium]|nr:hypothetical protein [Syntrophomonadaceae bacterium]